MRITIAGAGEVGRSLAGLFAARGDDVVLLDRDAAALAAAEETLDVLTLQGDTTHRSVLRRAEVATAAGFVAVSGSDQANLLAAALARSLGAQVAIARVDDPAFYEGDAGVEHDTLGVDFVFCAPRLTTARMLLQFDLAEIPFAESFAAHCLQVALWPVEPGSPAVGRSAAALALGRGAALRAVLRDGFVRGPEEVSALEPGDRLLVAGLPTAVAVARRRVLGGGGGRRAMVVGGGDVGALLAHNLLARDYRVSLIEAKAERCAELADTLPGVTILQGDATNPTFLRDVQVEEVEFVAAVTREEEVNLLTSLLVRQMGTSGSGPHTFMSVHRPGYAELCRRLGIEGTVSSFEVLSQAIAAAVARPGVVAKVPLPGTAWTVAELRLPQAAGVAPALRDLRLPETLRVLAVARGTEVLLPTPTLALHGGDSVLVASPARELGRAEGALLAALPRAPR